MPLYRPIVWLAAATTLFSWPFPSAADDPILIASLFSFSGTAAVTNYRSVEDVRWAINEINANGGINGRRLQLLELDNTSTPIGSKLAAEKAAAANVAAIIGPAYSSHCIAAARVAQQYGIPLVTNAATDPDVTRVGDYIFRVCFSDIFQNRLLARFARQELGAATAIILVNANSDYSLGLAREFVNRYGAVQTLTASSALAYDAVMLTADAIRRAGTAERSAIRRALADTNGFEGITGRISLDTGGAPPKTGCNHENRQWTIFLSQTSRAIKNGAPLNTFLALYL